MSDLPEKLDLLWSVRSIAAYIGRTERQTYEALAKGELPAQLLNGRWVASRQALFDFFCNQPASSTAAPKVEQTPPTPHALRPRSRSAVVHKLTPSKGRAA